MTCPIKGYFVWPFFQLIQIIQKDTSVKRLPRLRWVPLNFHIRQLVLPRPTPCLLARAVTNKLNWVIRDRHKFELQHMRTLTLLGK